MKLTILDQEHPEDLAMLQALYSRSPAPVAEHLEKVRALGSGKFMDTWYVGYGHRSIGDCGSCAVFVEGVSLLAAKAVQAWPLYSGQEASTRFMDFSGASCDDPAGTAASALVQARWLAAYAEAAPLVRERQAALHPRRDGEDERVWERAVAARTFDVCRSLLPAGVRTNLSWHTNLRQLADALEWLLEHPDRLVRELAEGVFEVARRRYPHSFASPPEPGSFAREQAIWRRGAAPAHFLVEELGWPYMLEPTVYDRTLSGWDAWAPLRTRPRGAELPPWFAAEAGVLETRCALDYGSWRDLARHRHGVVRVPLLLPSDPHPWYLEQMPAELARRTRALFDEQRAAVLALGLDPVEAQYYCALGSLVPVEVTQPLPGWVYRVELRCSKAVHPTLRAVAQAEARWFRRRYPAVALHADLDPDGWDVRRGAQTVEARPSPEPGQ